jgi:hypothetical protein
MKKKITIVVCCFILLMLATGCISFQKSNSERASEYIKKKNEEVYRKYTKTTEARKKLPVVVATYSQLREGALDNYGLPQKFLRKLKLDSDSPNSPLDIIRFHDAFLTVKFYPEFVILKFNFLHCENDIELENDEEYCYARMDNTIIKLNMIFSAKREGLKFIKRENGNFSLMKPEINAVAVVDDDTAVDDDTDVADTDVADVADVADVDVATDDDIDTVATDRYSFYLEMLNEKNGVLIYNDIESLYQLLLNEIQRTISNSLFNEGIIKWKESESGWYIQS